MRVLAPSRRMFLAGMGGLGLAACTGRTGPTTGARPSMAPSAKVEGELLLSNWVDFTSPDNLAAYSKQLGVKVTQEGYGSQEELLAKLGAGGSHYDVVVPGGDGLKTMIDRGLAMRLNRDLVPNLANIRPAFRDNPFDPGNAFGAPKDYGIASFFWRTAVVRERPRTLRECFALLPRYRSARVNVIESGNELINLALAALDLSINSEDEHELARARDLLLAAKPGVDTISSQYIERGQRGEIDFGIGYSGDVRRIIEARAKKGDEVMFLVPDGKTEYFVDYWVIPSAARHPVAAHKFINFMLDPANAAKEMNHIQFGVPITGIERYASPDIVRDPAVSIPDEVIRRYEIPRPLTPAGERLRNRMFTEFKAA